MEWVPAVNVDITNEAVPLTIAAVPSCVVPSRNVTDPPGGAADVPAPESVAVKVMEFEKNTGLEDEASAIPGEA